VCDSLEVATVGFAPSVILDEFEQQLLAAKGLLARKLRLALIAWQVSAFQQEWQQRMAALNKDKELAANSAAARTKIRDRVMSLGDPLLVGLFNAPTPPIPASDFATVKNQVNSWCTEEKLNFEWTDTKSLQRSAWL
jgi:hypothetical protein